MGLDISVSKIKEVSEDFYGEEGGYTVNEDFKEHSKNLDEHKFYDQDGDRLYHFHAGAYSGYGQWRRLLCDLYYKINVNEFWNNYDDYASKPFSEIINFSDCEGIIDWEMSAKLYKDFADNRQLLKSRLKEYTGVLSENRFFDLYDDFMKAFMLASENKACVLYH